MDGFGEGEYPAEGKGVEIEIFARVELAQCLSGALGQFRGEQEHVGADEGVALLLAQSASIIKALGATRTRALGEKARGPVDQVRVSTSPLVDHRRPLANEIHRCQQSRLLSVVGHENGRGAPWSPLPSLIWCYRADRVVPLSGTCGSA